MKGKIRTLTDRMPIRTMIASVFVAAVAAVGLPPGRLGTSHTQLTEPR